LRAEELSQANVIAQVKPTNPLLKQRRTSHGYPSTECHVHLLDDRALMTCDGGLLADSALFARPDQGHRTSPFYRTMLKLHSVSEAQHRHDLWAADEFDRINDRDLGGWIDQQSRPAKCTRIRGRSTPTARESKQPESQRVPIRKAVRELWPASRMCNVTVL
jgi:hypothetical protein